MNSWDSGEGSEGSHRGAKGGKDLPPSAEQVSEAVRRLKELARNAQTDSEARVIIAQASRMIREYRQRTGAQLSETPEAMAHSLDSKYVSRPHLQLQGERIAQAVADVEAGHNRMLAISMPPRSGKSTLASYYTPLWILRKHPEWSIITASYDSGLTYSWAKRIRQTIEHNAELGITLARDDGSGGNWRTEQGGGIFATSVRGAMTGRGAKVMIIDDPIKDRQEADSEALRDLIWNWWTTVASTRLEAPYLVIVIMTRWHQDDFIGRLMGVGDDGKALALQHPVRPINKPAETAHERSQDWEILNIPAIAESDDPLGREPGEPLLSPLSAETPEQASKRWQSVLESVGEYVFAAMFQGHPSPAKSAVFKADSWRFWTTDQSKVTEDRRIIYFNPSRASSGRWVDSWDMSFNSEAAKSSWVVGQRWTRVGNSRFLIAQKRGRWSFSQSLREVRAWLRRNDPVLNPFGHMVHQRLIENKANGPAIIDTLRKTVPGLKAINPRTSKIARARAITPEIESGHVYLPLPSDPGNSWVTGLLSELGAFPFGVNDDQVDALTQALLELRSEVGGISVPQGHVATAAYSGDSRLVAPQRLPVPAQNGNSRQLRPVRQSSSVAALLTASATGRPSGPSTTLTSKGRHV